MSIFSLLKKCGPGVGILVVVLLLKNGLFCHTLKDPTPTVAIDKCLDKIFPELPVNNYGSTKQKSDSKPKARIDETKTLDIPVKIY